MHDKYCQFSTLVVTVFIWVWVGNIIMQVDQIFFTELRQQECFSFLHLRKNILWFLKLAIAKSFFFFFQNVANNRLYYFDSKPELAGVFPLFFKLMSDSKHAVSHRHSDTCWNSCSTLGCFVFSRFSHFISHKTLILRASQPKWTHGFEITFIQITATALRLLRVPTSNPRLPFLPSHGCRSYLSNPCVWSSSQFRVTLRSHAWVESNLLWWKDKETLIEIFPSGHLVLWFHMGLDKLFSSRAAVHIVFDPSLQQ